MGTPPNDTDTDLSHLYEGLQDVLAQVLRSPGKDGLATRIRAIQVCDDDQIVGQAQVVVQDGRPPLITRMLVPAPASAATWGGEGPVDASSRWATHCKAVTRRILSAAATLAGQRGLVVIATGSPLETMLGELGCTRVGREWQTNPAPISPQVVHNVTMPHDNRYAGDDPRGCPPNCPARPELVKQRLPARTWADHGRPVAGVWWGSIASGLLTTLRDGDDGTIIAMFTNGTQFRFPADIPFRLADPRYWLSDVPAETTAERWFWADDPLTQVRLLDQTPLPDGADCSMLGGPGAESGLPHDGIGPDLGPILDRLQQLSAMPAYPPLVRDVVHDVEALVAEVAARRAVPTGATVEAAGESWLGPAAATHARSVPLSKVPAGAVLLQPVHAQEQGGAGKGL